MNEPPWVGRVLDFWFREIDSELWFAGNDALDERIRKDFIELHGRIAMSDAQELAGARTCSRRSSSWISFPATCFEGRRAPLPVIRWRADWLSIS